MKLRLTPRAVEDIEQISDYLRERSPASMRHAREIILEAFRRLVRFPRLGRRQDVEGVRKLVTRQQGFLIYYLMDDEHDELVVLSVRHPARDREHGNR